MCGVAVGFGGVRESGYGREGGREGCYEYLKPRHRLNRAQRNAVSATPAGARKDSPLQGGLVDRTAKLYIGGKFPRTESGRSYEVTTPKGKFLANAALASRKDGRDAVVAARAAQPGWASPYDLMPRAWPPAQ